MVEGDDYLESPLRGIFAAIQEIQEWLKQAIVIKWLRARPEVAHRGDRSLRSHDLRTEHIQGLPGNLGALPSPRPSDLRRDFADLQKAIHRPIVLRWSDRSLQLTFDRGAVHRAVL
jgi:hypothetical protein